MTFQVPGGPPLDAVSQLLLSLAAFLGAVSWTVLKIMDRKDSKQTVVAGGTLTNGALERLARAERDVVEVERRVNEQFERMREDSQTSFADVNRKLDRWDERWEEWLKERLARG